MWPFKRKMAMPEMGMEEGEPGSPGDFQTLESRMMAGAQRRVRQPEGRNVPSVDAFLQNARARIAPQSHAPMAPPGRPGGQAMMDAMNRPGRGPPPGPSPAARDMPLFDKLRDMGSLGPKGPPDPRARERENMTQMAAAERYEVQRRLDEQFPGMYLVNPDGSIGLRGFDH